MNLNITEKERLVLINALKKIAWEDANDLIIRLINLNEHQTNQRVIAKKE